MKRKNLSVTKKVNKKQINKKKFNKFYKKFKNIIFNNIERENFAIGVSGGPDSLSLAYFSKAYTDEFKNKMEVLIINHKIRKESSKEALKVKKILKRKKIESKILNCKSRIPKSNIQHNARNVRYSLLADYCLKKNIKYSKSCK